MNDLSQAHLDTNRHLEKISRGERLAKAKEDSAAHAVAENLDTQVRSMAVAERNINDGIAMLDVLHGGIQEIQNSVKTIRELSVQAASETLSQDERDTIKNLIDEETNTLVSIARTTNWQEKPTDNNEMMLFGPVDNVDVQVGTHNTANDRISVDTFDAVKFFVDVKSNREDQIYFNVAASIYPGASGKHHNDTDGKPMDEIHAFDLTSAEGAQKALDKVDKQMDFLNQQLAANGASRNQLSRALSNVSSQGSVLASARSKIRDADFAAETAGLAKAQILAQSGTAVMAQAQRMNQGAIRLLS
jgi:flagellin